MAYDFRFTTIYSKLARKQTSPRDVSCWSRARHHVGRLGSWMRAAKVLVEVAAKEPFIVDRYNVRQIGLPSAVLAPEADQKTNLESAVLRMLPKDDKRLPHIQATLKSFRAIDVARKFEELYRDKNFKPREHAEVNLFEFFFQNGLNYSNNVPYIGCSKASCYCCDLYMSAHPSENIPRACHGNVFPSWRPPLLPYESDEDIGKHSRDMINTMTKSIRQKLFRLIDQKTAYQNRLPDSSTGISDIRTGLENLDLESLAVGISHLIRVTAPSETKLCAGIRDWDHERVR